MIPKNNTKLYIPVVTFSINNNIKFLEHLKQEEFRRTVSLNNYRYEISTELKNNNLDCMIDPTFRKINSLLVFLFKNGDDDPTRNSFEVSKNGAPFIKGITKIDRITIDDAKDLALVIPMYNLL